MVIVPAEAGFAQGIHGWRIHEHLVNSSWCYLFTGFERMLSLPKTLMAPPLLPSAAVHAFGSSLLSSFREKPQGRPGEAEKLSREGLRLNQFKTHSAGIEFPKGNAPHSELPALPPQTLAQGVWDDAGGHSQPRAPSQGWHRLCVPLPIPAGTPCCWYCLPLRISHPRGKGQGCKTHKSLTPWMLSVGCEPISAAPG